MIKSTWWSIIISLLLLPQICYSQCGMTPVIELNIFTPGFGIEYSAINSIPNNNCIVYQHQWEVNGSIKSTQISSNLYLEYGFNEVVYKAWLTDTVTNDSCYSEYKNIYASTGQNYYVGTDLSVSGMNVTASPYFWGDVILPGTTITVDWGDGTINTSFNHTYTNPGQYSVCVTVTDGNLFGHSCGVAQVANGLPNLIDGSSFISSSCGQILHQTYGSVPAFPYAGVSFEPLETYNVANNNIPAPPPSIRIDTMAVPGQFIVQYYLTDPNGFGNSNTYFHPFAANPCGIIPDTIRGFCWYDDDQDGLIDSTESPAIGETVMIDAYTATTDSMGNYEILMPRFDVLLSVNTLYTSLPPFKLYSISPNSSQLHENFNFGILNGSATIRGRVFLDLNYDSLSNAGDLRLENVFVKAKNTLTNVAKQKKTNSSGDYIFYLAASDYEITVDISNIDSSTVYPDTIFIPNSAGNFNNNNFAVYSTATGVNHCLVMSSNRLPRPGFDYEIRSFIYNLGLDTASSELLINYDPAIIVTGTDPPSGVVDSVNNTVTWQLPPVFRSAPINLTVYCSLPSVVALGTPLQSTGLVTLNPPAIDYHPNNNSAFINQIVTGSFDPNDKLVNPEIIDLTPGANNPDDFFYHINFQNTGTASAINIVVEDEIDPNLNLATLQMLDASHFYTMIINNRTVSWTFSSINLPDSNSNEPDSHGWIEYTIKPIANLPVGTIIKNEAAIYFDFNAPIITNTATTEYVISTGVTEDPDGTDLIIYPNPANTIVNIRSSRSMKKVSVYNALGGLIEENEVLNGSKLLGLNIEDYSSGIYFITVYLGDEVVQRKLIK